MNRNVLLFGIVAVAVSLLYFGCARRNKPHAANPVFSSSEREERTQDSKGKPAFLDSAGNKLPSIHELGALKPEDEPALIEDFSRSALTDKVRAAWGLAHLGSPRALQTLKQPFEADYQNRVFSGDEEPALLMILKAVGYLGQRSDEAYHYLVTSLSSEVWKARIRWKQQPGFTAESNVRYTGLSAMALAMTGHPEAMSEITKLMAREEGNVSKIASGIATAVFYLHHIKEYGKDALISDTLTANTFSGYQKFLRTETGKAWYTWFRKMEGLPIEE